MVSFSNKNVRRIRIVTAWICLTVLLGIIGFEIEELERKGSLSDFVAYWAAGRLNAHGDNPYDADKLLCLQKQIGWDKKEPERWWSPPLALLLYMPFGILNYSSARVLWQFLQLGLIFFCTDWLWRHYKGPLSYRWLAWAIGQLFFPTLYMMQEGQNGGFLLLGVVGFMHFIKRGKGCYAGTCLLLLAIKPHLFTLFWIALAIWVIEKRFWSVFLGMLLSAFLATAIPLAVNPTVINQYINASTAAPTFLFNWATPTLGTALRVLWGDEKTWLQIMPTAIGIIWLLIYWKRNYQEWDWIDKMPFLLLVSAVTAFYEWGFDQVVLLVAVIQAGVLIFQIKHKWTVIALTTFFLLGNSLPIILAIKDEFWYIWTAPWLLLWYILVCRFAKEIKSRHHDSL
jgi:hypothetical protein